MTDALLIIDVWDQYHPGYDYLKTPMQHVITRIASVVEKFHGPVVMASYQTPNDGDFPWQAPHHLVKMKVDGHHNSIISWDTDIVNNFLRTNNVDRVNYVGFSIPGCIENRPLGINNIGYKYRIVGDCVLNLTSCSTDPIDITHDTYRYIMDNKYPMIHSGWL